MLRRILPLCLTGLLVACGGSADSETATSGTTDAASTAATTNPPVAASSGVSPTTPDAAPTGSAPAATSAPVVAVPAALQLTAPLVGGGEIELDAYAGRPVLLWFWAPW